MNNMIKYVTICIVLYIGVTHAIDSAVSNTVDTISKRDQQIQQILGE